MAKRGALRLSILARRDLQDAVIYYESQQAHLGQRFLGELVEAIDTIVERPTSLPVVHRDIRRARLDKFPYGVFFRMVDGVIRIIAIVDLRRRSDVWQRRI
jgi:plasmid stabilization system protein ParE